MVVDAALHGRTVGRVDQPTALLTRAVRRMLDEAGSSLARGDVLALCSGGADSVVLVDVLAGLSPGARPARLEVLYLDHGLRDTRRDEAAARSVAGRHSLAMHVRRAAADVNGVDLTDRCNVQARARTWRLVVAQQLASERGCDVVCVGHTADDQLEGVLHALVAGSGLRASAGMPVERRLTSGARLVRPLLGSSRSAVRVEAVRRGLGWAEDPSNAAGPYARTQVRHEVVPRLLDVHPGAGRNLERRRRQQASVTTSVDDLANALLDRAGSTPTLLAVDVLAGMGSAGRRALLAAWLRRAGVGRAVSARTLAAIDRLVETHDAHQLPATHVALAGGRCVVHAGYCLQVLAQPPERHP